MRKLLFLTLVLLISYVALSQNYVAMSHDKPETKQKAKYIQKKYNQKLGELIDVYRKIDPALSRMILLNVFEDLYPREERPEDPILI